MAPPAWPRRAVPGGWRWTISRPGRRPAAKTIRHLRAGGDRAPLSRRGLSLDDLAEPARPDHELGGRDHGARDVADLQRALCLAVAAHPRRAAGRGLSDAGIAALSLFQRLARALPADGDRPLRAVAARPGGARSTASGTCFWPTTTSGRGFTSATGGRSGVGSAATMRISWRSRRSPTTASSRSIRSRRRAGRPSCSARRWGRCRGFSWFRGNCVPRLLDRVAAVTLIIERRHRARSRPVPVGRARGCPRLAGGGVGLRRPLRGRRRRQRRSRCRRRAPGCRIPRRLRPRPAAPGWSCRRPEARPPRGCGRR